MVNTRHLLTSLALLFAAGTACAGDLPPLPEAWRSEQGRDHPLVGTIHDTAANKRVAPEPLIDRLSRARFILLGETHTNPDHHRHQAWVLRALAAHGRSPAVVWEMIGADQADALRRFQAEPDADAAELGEALAWAESGWPAWRLYRPIAEAALAHDLPMRAGAPGEAERGAIAHDGVAELDDTTRRSLALDEPLPPPLRDGLRKRLATAHCGDIPADVVDSMLAMQRLRDATLADNLIRAAETAGSAVLVAGSGHVRGDWGVPWYLRQRDASGVVTVAFREVRPDAHEPSAYLPDGADRRGLDLVWFTPRAEASEHECSGS